MNNSNYYLTGNIYHGRALLENPDHQPFWWKALDQGVKDEEVYAVLSEYRGGVDYPVSLFYKELMVAFPNAKILLNVRDAKKWYTSVRDSIFKLIESSGNSWPVSWFYLLVGKGGGNRLFSALGAASPAWSSSGLGMFQAVAAGEATAVRFYHDHVNEVKKHVPADRLLVWEVKEGWEPLCKFLGLPIPDEPFPQVNDTNQIRGLEKSVVAMAWLGIVLVPISIALAAYHFSLYQPRDFVMMAVGYLGVLWLLRAAMLSSLFNYEKKK